MRSQSWGRSQVWDQMSTRSKVLTMLLVSLQVSLAVSAWTDLARRPAEQVNGKKRWWAIGIAVDFIGPLAYFWRGRRRSTT